MSPHRIALAAAMAAALATPLLAGAAEKRKGKRSGLSEAVVHVLTAEGDAAEGVEVVLEITRSDGTSDRRIATSGADGEAVFPDVRRDCREIRASALTDAGPAEGRLRKCGADLEAFLVLPAAPAEAAPAPEPEAGPEIPEPVVVEEDPYSAPAPAPPGPEVAPPEEPADREEEPGLVELRGRLGIDACVEWFYDLRSDQVGCDEMDPVGVGLEVDLAVHFEEWFLFGLLAGYHYIGAELEEEDESGEPTGELEGISSHMLVLGLPLRFQWILGKRPDRPGGSWIVSLTGVPVGLFRQIVETDEKTYESNEFFVAAEVAGGYFVGEATWLGVYVELLQPMPWVHSDGYRTGTMAAGVAVGTRFGSPAADEEPAAEGDPDEDDGGSDTGAYGVGDPLLRHGWPIY